MSLLQRILRTDSVSYEVYGFWRCLGRQIWRALPVRFTNWWDNHIRTIYAPQQSSLRASIPKTYQDLDETIAGFLYACVISFVENEDGLKDWEGQDEQLDEVMGGGVNPRRQQAPMLREIYDWAKTGREAASNQAVSAAPYLSLEELVAQRGDSVWVAYRRISEDAEERDRRYLRWVVDYREYMWT